MKSLLVLLGSWLAIVAAIYPTYDGSRELRRSHHLLRRAPMKSFLNQKPTSKKPSELKTPLLSQEAPHKESQSHLPHGRLTVTAPVTPSGRGVHIDKKEADQKTNSVHFSDNIRWQTPGAKPDPPGARQTVTGANDHKVVLDGWAAHAKTSQMNGEMTGKRVSVKMGFYNGGVGSVRKKNSNGEWEDQKIITSKDQSKRIDGNHKMTFSNPDGSPVTVQASNVGGRLKMSGKNYAKGI